MRADFVLKNRTPFFRLGWLRNRVKCGTEFHMPLFNLRICVYLLWYASSTHQSEWDNNSGSWVFEGRLVYMTIARSIGHEKMKLRWLEMCQLACTGLCSVPGRCVILDGLYIVIPLLIVKGRNIAILSCKNNRNLLRLLNCYLYASKNYQLSTLLSTHT